MSITFCVVRAVSTTLTGLATALAALLISVAGVIVAAPADAADDGRLRIEAGTTFELRPDEEKVHVTVDMRLTNRVADERRSDGAILYTVYETVSLFVPAEATNVSARRAGGGALATFDRETEDPRWRELGVRLSPDLRFGSPQTIEISYDLPDQPPRAEGLVRANPVYTLFPVYPVGDPEYASVTVVVPDVYDHLDVGGTFMRRSNEDGLVTFTADPIGDEFYATVAARNDDLLAEREVRSGDHTFMLRYVPGDEEWADFAEDVVTRGVPVLEEAIGEPWPGGADLEIIESSSPHALGYGGWFDLEANAIEVTDHLDAVVMLHELAHAWFNHDTMGDRWLREGFADLYADIAVRELPGLEPAAEPGPSDADAPVALAEWDESAIGARDVDRYGYETSWWAMAKLYDEIGAEAMSDVLAAVFDKQNPYAAVDGGREEIRGPVDWRRMLDLLEEVGGSELAGTIYVENVVDDGGADSLERRDEAREVYSGFTAQAPEWGVPYELRRTMSTWTFPRVEGLVGEAGQVLRQRDDILTVLSGLGVDELPALRAEYRDAERLDEVVERGEEYLGAVARIEAAQERPDGALGWLTTVGTALVPAEYSLTDAAGHVAGGELDEARSVAAGVAAEVERAALHGAVLLGQALLCLLLVPFIVRAARRRRRRRSARTLEPVPDEAETPAPTI